MNINQKNLKVIDNVKSYFQFDKRKAILSKEILGGLSTFFAMMYILIVNPSILIPAAGEEYMGALFLGTAISSFIATLIMGLVAKVPVAAAPGMGINAFLTYTVCFGFGLTYGEGLVSVFVSGILYFIIGITPLRKIIIKSVPKNFKIAMGSMIGLFIAFIGLFSSGIIIQDPTGATPTSIGNFNNPLMIIALVLTLLGLILHFCKVKYAIVCITIIGLIAVLITGGVNKQIGNEIFQLNSFDSFSNFGNLSEKMWISFSTAFKKPLFYVAVFTFLYVDFFDTTGMIATLEDDKSFKKITILTKNDKYGWVEKVNLIDACCSTMGSIFLTSSVTALVESKAAVMTGAKTGIASIVTALCFLISIPLWPILNPIMPIMYDGIHCQPITGPILVMIGGMMLIPISEFDWKKGWDIPVLIITILIGMLAYSISLGITFGSITYVIVYAFKGLIEFVDIKKAQYKTKVKEKINIKLLFKELNLVMLTISTISLIYLILDILIRTKILIS